jgi:hypothetical protein
MRSLSFKKSTLCFVGAIMISSAAHAAYPEWTEGTTYTVGTIVSYQGHDYQVIQTHTALPGAGWTPPTTPTLWKDLGADSNPSPAPAPAPAPVPSPTPSTGATLPGPRARSIARKACASRIAAGITKANGGRRAITRAKADYLYGSVLGQLLQENLETQLYQSSGNLIDPSKDQQAVMGAGQGGPHQINNYAADMVSGTYAPAGHSLINYIAVQKNIGFTMADAATQNTKPTPASFNDKYYDPMLTAYFHYNDLVALVETGKGTGGWTTPWQPAFDNALSNFKNLPGSFFDMLLNVAYNQGFYGTLMSSYSKQGTTASAATVTQVNDWSSVWGKSDSYAQYPYQVRYYLNQFYDRPIPTASATALTTPQNHVAFNMSKLGNVFTNVFTKLSFVNSTGQGAFISDTAAISAYSTALTQHGISESSTLDLSNSADRETIFGVLDDAIHNLEKNLNMQFNATTNSQI